MNVCPVCLQESNPSQFEPDSLVHMCQECKQNVATVVCATCNAELCQQCSEQIHRFSVNKNHFITDLSKSVTATTQQLYCQCPIHQQITNAVTMNSQADIAQYYIPNLHIVVCKACASSQYPDQAVDIEQYYNQVALQIQSQNEKVKELINQTSTLISQYKQIQQIDKRTVDQSINQVNILKQQLFEVINYKFAQIEAIVKQNLQNSQQWNNKQAENLSKLFEEAVTSFVVLQKHLNNRNPTVFLTEYQKLNDLYQLKLNDLLSDLEVREPVRQFQQVQLNGMKEAQQAIQNIQVDGSQDKYYDIAQSQINNSQTSKLQIVQQQGLMCSNCGNIIIPSVQQITDVAEKQKGNLYGIRPEDINQNGIICDDNSGTPGSRHILCSRCKKEIGRYSQPDAEEKKFTPGYLFLSINCLK